MCYIFTFQSNYVDRELFACCFLGWSSRFYKKRTFYVLVIQTTPTPVLIFLYEIQSLMSRNVHSTWNFPITVVRPLLYLSNFCWCLRNCLLLLRKFPVPHFQKWNEMCIWTIVAMTFKRKRHLYHCCYLKSIMITNAC